MIVTFFTKKVVRSIDMSKALFCSLVDNSSFYFKVNPGDKKNFRIPDYKQFSITLPGSEISITADIIGEVLDYITYGLSDESESKRDDVAATVATWMSQISEKLLLACIGNSIKGTEDGWVTKSHGVDGIDINVEKLAKMLRLSMLVKEEEQP